MEQYARSVQGVDEALRRLNTTLASYRISHNGKSPVDTRGSAQTGIPVVSIPNASATAVEGRQKVPREGPWADVVALRCTQDLLNIFISKAQLNPTLSLVSQIFDEIRDNPYCLPLYIVQSWRYLQLGYPDLAAGAAYKALLLSDAIQDASDEYHGRTCEALRKVVVQQPLMERIQLLKAELHADAEARLSRLEDADEQPDVEVDLWLRVHYLPLTYRLLSQSLYLCDCHRTAVDYAFKGIKLYPNDNVLESIRANIAPSPPVRGEKARSPYADARKWPNSGLVRRELYPWNIYEPDRFADLPALNRQMAEVAPKLEVRAVDLPALGPASGKKISTQLGVFAKEDFEPGELILDELSFVTANNKLQDLLCDCCSNALPDGDGPRNAEVIGCLECDIVFCSQRCNDLAMETYHPALCGLDDVEAIAKDVKPADAADSLYSLLLLRVLAYAESNECHPLECPEIKYVWGDFHKLPLDARWLASPSASNLSLPRTLPFSFDQNIRLPFHMLERMNIDIFASPHYDVWVFNTLYAKFRGTASARLSGAKKGARARGPEVCAVHALWSLANHSCDPNVRWEWTQAMEFEVREERVGWKGKTGRATAGIRKGEEILSHYCDIELGVNDRRAWASGALGGDCMCERCKWEAALEGEEEREE